MSTKKNSDAGRLINILLSSSLERRTFGAMADWFKDFNQQTRHFSQAIDRAMLGGRMSANVGFTFSSAYQSAIEALFNPTEILLSSFCVTEEQGNHPRSIQTRLFEDAGQLLVTGSKSFVSGANDSQCLYIACRDERNGNGFDADGRPIIKMLSLKTDIEGVDVKAMPALGFIPEVSHGKVTLNNVLVTQTQVYPEDGYVGYVKAFRSYEDLYVLAAIVAYRLGEAVDQTWPEPFLEEHVSLVLALRSLSDMDLTKPAAHIGLAACRSQLTVLIEKTNTLFSKSDPEGYQRWCRDKVLLNIAQKAHEKRTTGAWEMLNIKQ